MHWKNLCWSWSSNTLATWCEELIDWKRPWCRERLRAWREGSSREIVGWHHNHLNEHEFEQTPGDGEGQGSLACCSPWGCKESDTRLSNWTTTSHIWVQSDILLFFFPTNLCINNSLTKTSSFQETAYINQTLESARCGCQPYITTHLLAVWT